MMNSQINSILLIDDDQDDKYFFATALEEVDPNVSLSTAAEGQEALDKLRYMKPDLILLDLVMPGMNGVGFLKAIKKNKDLSGIPVIVYTTDLSIFEEEEVLSLGAVQVYIKPLDFESTLETIHHLLNSTFYRKSA